jgi:small subunit ribosomal protein S3
MGNKLPLFDLRHKRNRSFWYCDKYSYGDMVSIDNKVRKLIKQIESNMSMEIQNVIVSYYADNAKIDIYTTKPGIVFGKGGAHINMMMHSIAKILEFDPKFVHINPISISRPEIDPAVIASSIATDMKRRRSYNRSMKTMVSDAIKFGALGARVECSGRLNGVEIARRVVYSEGKVPRNTIKANIYYALAEAHTDSGVCGIKTWVNLKPGVKLNERKRIDGGPR